MNCDKEYKTEKEYITYLLRNALAQVEIFDSTYVTISVHSEEYVDDLSYALALLFYDREDVEIYIKLELVN